MSIREQIAALEELSAVDVELRRIDEALDKHQKGLSGMRSEVKGLEDRLSRDRDTLAAMDKTRNELVAESRQMSQQIERSREKLNRSRNERESNAAQRELEELRKLHRDREDEISKINSMADAARASISDADGKRTNLSGELEGSAPGITTSIDGLNAEKASLTEKRGTIVPRLPPALYRRYESIRTRRPVAIAMTTDGTCQGCRIAIPPMMFQTMRRADQIEQCPQCRRLLYYVPPAEAAEHHVPESTR